MWSKVNLREMIPMPAVVVGALVLAFSFNLVYGQVSLPNRPFAVKPDTMDQLFDGIFDIALDDQLIGVFLKNEGSSTIRNVRATASFDAGSGIVLTNSGVTFGDLEPGVPVLGFFRASFRGSTPSKQRLTLNLNGDSFSQVVARNLFVARSEPGPGSNAYTVYIPEGRTIFEVLGFYEGTNLGSLTALTSYKQSVTYNAPYSGQFAPIPFNDPWWKVAGACGMIGGGLTMITGGIARSCGAGWGQNVFMIGAGVGTTSAGVTALDIKDPIRRGQENTMPGDGEVTLREEVVLTADYLQEPVIGTLYSANVSWTYTRTTNVQNYTYSVNEVVSNDIHYTTNRNVNVTTDGDTLIVTASANGPGGPLTNNDAIFFGKVYRADDGQLVNMLGSLVLRDDGHQGDAVAGDGIYTGSIATTGWPTNLSVYVSGYDINNASASDPPLVAAQKIGGWLVSPPSFIAYDSANATNVARCVIQSDADTVSVNSKAYRTDPIKK